MRRSASRVMCECMEQAVLHLCHLVTGFIIIYLLLYSVLSKIEVPLNGCTLWHLDLISDHYHDHELQN